MEVAGADPDDLEQAAARFLTWLETTERRWLVVLDDLSDPADLRRLWPRRRSRAGPGHHSPPRCGAVRRGPDGRRGPLARAAADALLAAWPDVERDTDLAQALRSGAAMLARYAPDALWEPAAHPIVFRAGRSLGEAGLTADAIAYFRSAADLAARHLGPDHPSTLQARHELGYWRGESGDFAGAADSQRKLLADRLRVLGPDHPNTLGTRANLAYWRGHAATPPAPRPPPRQ